jgi:hypothetical protein
MWPRATMNAARSASYARAFSRMSTSMEGSAARWRNSRAGELLSRCCRGEAIGVDGNNGPRIGAWVPVLITGVVAFWVTSGIALADPSLPDPSAPVDAASSAASSATDAASGAVDSATSAADDVVTSASNEAESAGDSVVSTAESAAAAAPSAGGGASSASQAGGASSASEAGGGSSGAPSSGAAGGSTGSTPSSPAGSPSDAGSGNATVGDRTSGGRGERGKLASRYDGGSANHDAGGRGRDEGRGGRARQAPRDSDGPTPGEDDDGGRIGDLTELVQSGQEIGASTTVSVVTSSDGSDDPPLFEGLPITGFEVSVFFAAGAGLASLGVALLSYARERSGDSGRPRLS